MTNLSSKNKKQSFPMKSSASMQAILKFKQTLNDRLSDSIAELTDSSHSLSLLDQALSLITD